MKAYISLLRVVIILVFTFGRGAIGADTGANEAASNTHVRAVFNSDCEKALIRQINLAKDEVLVAVYNITRRNITSALGRAAKRGVKVKVKYDAGSHRDSDGMTGAIEYLRTLGVDCVAIKIKDKEGRMHNKFTLVDRKIVVTGSFNYTTTASTLNYENIVVIESPEIAKEYIEEFEKIKNK